MVIKGKQKPKKLTSKGMAARAPKAATAISVKRLRAEFQAEIAAWREALADSVRALRLGLDSLGKGHDRLQSQIDVSEVNSGGNLRLIRELEAKVAALENWKANREERAGDSIPNVQNA